MMKNFIFVLACVLSTSTIAATGHGYKILGSRIESDPRFHFHVEDVNPISSSNQSSSTTKVPPKEGKINENIEVDGYHDINIYNDTKETQTYETIVQLKCHEMQNSFYEYVQIEPNGVYTSEKHTSGVVQSDIQASYYSNGDTFVALNDVGESHSGDASYVSFY